MLLKVLFSVIAFKIGRHAIQTFKPIVADVKKEEAEGIPSQEIRSNSIKNFLGRTRKLLFLGFILFIISFFALKCFATRTTHLAIDSLYENHFQVDREFTHMHGEPIDFFSIFHHDATE
jgi:hypothetical protein